MTDEKNNLDYISPKLEKRLSDLELVWGDTRFRLNHFNERITEMEKKFDECLRQHSNIMNVYQYTQLKERIEKLEKNAESNNKELESQNTELSELKVQVSGLQTGNTADHISTLGKIEELKELKEQLDGVQSNLIALQDTHKNDYFLLEGVLRELFECLISDRIPNKPEDWDLLMIDKFRYLLKKLTGGENAVRAGVDEEEVDRRLPTKNELTKQRELTDSKTPRCFRCRNEDYCALNGAFRLSCKKEDFRDFDPLEQDLEIQEIVKRARKEKESTEPLEDQIIKEFNKINTTGHILVEKADLEFLFELADRADKFDCWPRFEKLKEKYLPEDK